MAFIRSENEFLRIAALSQPDWTKLEDLGSTVGFDWTYLRQTALKHQMDGLIAWRLISPQLYFIVPEIVQDECQKDLDYLSRVHQDAWIQDGTLIVNQMNTLSIPWVLTGGPAQYAPLGILGKAWPRAWTDFDVWIDVPNVASITPVAKELGVETLAINPTWWKVRLASGMTVELHTRLHYTAAEDGDRWLPWENAVTQDILGITIPVPSPLLTVAMMATQTWNSVWEASTRLPLWGLARLAAWVGHVDWSWEALTSLLATNVSWCRANPLPNVIDEPGKAQNEWWCSAYRAAWILEAADRVYNIFPTNIRDSGLIHPSLQPSYKMTMETYDAREVVWGDGQAKQRYSCEINNYPSDENFIFNMDEVESVDARKSNNLWTEVRPETTDISVGTWQIHDLDIVEK